MSEDFSKLLTDPIEGPHTLDAFWNAYQKTQSLDYPRRIVSVLDWEDIVRSKLTHWLAQLPPGFEATKEFDTFQDLFIQWKMPVDCTRRAIEGPLDLDLLVALLARNGELKFEEFPVALEMQEIIRLSMKSAALWSLRSVASHDNAIANLCEAEAQKPGGAARPLLATST